MRLLSWIIPIFALVSLGKTELCAPNVTMYDLPGGVLKSMIAMVTVGTALEFVGCKKDVTIDPERVVFWLYNNQNRDVPIRLERENPKQIKSNQKTVFITHGWTCNITGDGFPELKDAYLKSYPESNVILVEWTTYSVDLYIHSYCFIPKIAEVFGQFVCHLNTTLGVDIDDLHLIGHSMGAQISGLVGQEVQKICKKKIGRITALDPAGPIYQMASKSERLDATDAAFVDVIHTNQAQFGYYGGCGTVDYYPNCGYFQPKCLKLPVITNVSEILNVPFLTFACSHQRSIQYFLESITSEGFESKSCTLCPGLPPAGLCVADYISSSTSVMGEHNRKNKKISHKAYYLTTNDKSPFAKSA